MLLDRVSREEVPAHLFSDAERAALKFADQHCLQSINGTLDEFLAADLKSHFDAGQIVEHGIICAVLTGMPKFIFVNNLVPKMDHCPVRARASV